MNEPWELGMEHETMTEIRDNNGKRVVTVEGNLGSHKEIRDKAERIIACVNLLQAFSTERLAILMADKDRWSNAVSSIEDAIQAAAGECG